MTDETGQLNDCAVLLYAHSMCGKDERNGKERDKEVSSNYTVHEYPDQGEWLCSEKWECSFTRMHGYATSPLCIIGTDYSAVTGLMTTGLGQDISRKEGFLFKVILMHCVFSGAFN
jgi:hypothetical protein